MYITFTTNGILKWILQLELKIALYIQRTSFRILNVTFSQRCEHKCKWIHVLQQYSRRVNEIDMEEWENERERERDRETERKRSG